MTNYIEINKEVFEAVITARGYSRRKIGKESKKNNDWPSDRTIRRNLNDGSMKACYFDNIAKKINVMPSYLSGEEYEKLERKYEKLLEKYKSDDQEEIKKKLLLRYINQIDQYPYSRKEYEEIRRTSLKESLSYILALFEISYVQYEKMDNKKQYEFQHELYEGMSKVLGKYFKEDALGDEEMFGLNKILLDLEAKREAIHEEEYADIVLRSKYVKNVPIGYIKKEVEAMQPEDLIALDMVYDEYKDIAPKYKKIYLDNPPKGFTRELIEKMTYMEIYNLYKIIDEPDPFKEKYIQKEVEFDYPEDEIRKLKEKYNINN